MMRLVLSIFLTFSSFPALLAWGGEPVPTRVIFDVYVHSSWVIVTVELNNGQSIFSAYRAVTARSDDFVPYRSAGSVMKGVINPSWSPTEATKAAYQKRGKILKDYYPPLHPDNALGRIALYLSHSVNSGPTLRLHDTNKPEVLKKEKRRESRGCVRTFFVDIAEYTTYVLAAENGIPVSQATEMLNYLLETKKEIAIDLSPEVTRVTFHAG